LVRVHLTLPTRVAGGTPDPGRSGPRPPFAVSEVGWIGAVGSSALAQGSSSSPKSSGSS